MTKSYVHDPLVEIVPKKLFIPRSTLEIGESIGQGTVVPLLRDHPTVPAKCGLSREVVFHQGDEQDRPRFLYLVYYDNYIVCPLKIISNFSFFSFVYSKYVQIKYKFYNNLYLSGLKSM